MDALMDRNSMKHLKNRYFGRVIDNFKCDDPNLHKSLSDSMGEYLFYHIVDSPQTATQILSGLNCAKLPGQINFFALNIIDACEFDKPDALSQFNFDAKFQKMFEKIFSEMSLDHNCDKDFNSESNYNFSGESVDHDFIEEEGSFVGVKRISNSVGLYQEQQQLTDMEESTRFELIRNVHRMDATMLSINETSVQLDQQRETMRQIRQIQTALNNTKHSINESETRVQSLQSQLQNHQTKLNELNASKNQFENELPLDLLTNQEEQEYHEVHQAIIEKRVQLQRVINAMEELEIKRKSFTDFRDGLMSRYNGLQEQSENYSKNSIALILQEKELEQLEESKRNAEQRLNEIHLRMVDFRNEIENRNRPCNELEQAKVALQDKQNSLFIEIETKKTEKRTLMAELNRLREQKPYDATQIHNPDIVDLTEPEVNSHLEIARHQLRTYENTNTFDSNLLDNFKKDREALCKRRTQMTNWESTILAALEKFDSKKIDASVKSTFDDLAKCFSTNFLKFVPDGSASLELIETASNQTDIDFNQNANEIVGVDIFARFQQIEKSFADLLEHERKVVSLVFIISMQQLSPTPFYLFSSIDEVIEILNFRIAAVCHNNANHFFCR